MHIRKLFVAGVAAACLGACSTVNDGVSDIKQWQNGGWKQFGPETDQRLGKSDHFSIVLKRAFIQDFQEMAVSTNGTLTRGNPFLKHGEIAILVNATAAGAAAQTRSTDTTKQYDQYRLVYYSDDVYQNQVLSFINAPIWGPGAVASDQLKLEFIVLELDRTSPQTEQLLKTLAGLAKLPSAMTGPMGEALLALGTSLVTSANDDRQMRFEATFDLNDTGDFALRPGNYVLTRVEDRENLFDWEQVCVNEGDGLLYQRVGSQCDPKPVNQYKKNSYLSILVSPRDPDAQAFASETFGELTAQLNAQVNPTITKVSDIAAAYATNTAERRNQSGLMTEWRELEKSTANLADAKLARVGAATECTNIEVTDATVQKSLTDLNIRVATFFADLTRMKTYVTKKKANAADPTLTVNDALAASDFEVVGRTALAFVGNANLSAPNTMDVEQIGVDGLFKSSADLTTELAGKADKLRDAAKGEKRCRSAPAVAA